jgi:hypothetical protein
MREWHNSEYFDGTKFIVDSKGYEDIVINAGWLCALTDIKYRREWS